MLHRFEIKNFRSCKHVILDDLRSITGLVGRNGSGKTNILKAIAFLFDTTTSSDLLDESELLFSSSPISGSMVINAEDEIYRYSMAFGPVAEQEDRLLGLRETVSVQRRNGEWELLVRRRPRQIRVAGRPEPIAIEPTIPMLPAVLALLPGSAEIQEHVRPLFDFFHNARYYPLDKTSEATGHDGAWAIPRHRYEAWAKEYRINGECDDSVVMRLIYAAREDRSRFQEIESLLGPTGLDLIQKILVQRLFAESHNGEANDKASKPSHFVVKFRLGGQLGGGNELRTFNELSLGTRRLLELVVALIFDQRSLMLIEHPEDGIHSGLLRKVIDLLRANADPIQIILSSHSETVLNSMAAHDIRLVSIRRGSTDVRPLTRKEVSAAAHFIEDDGTLREFLETVEE